MKDNELKELLNAVYEMEGMIHLSLNRKQDPGLLRELIVKKSETIMRLASTLSPEETDKADEKTDNPVSDDTAMYQAEDTDNTVGTVPVTEPVTQEPVPERNITDKMPLRSRPDARPALRRCFPINEIYLFRRELFDGSDVDFNASLRIVEELPTYAQAEDYFISDLQWDASDPNVANFLSIIRKNFKR